MQGLKHEESGSEDEWTEDEEEGTALQAVEPFSVVADTLRGVQAHNPARFQVRHGMHTLRPVGKGRASRVCCAPLCTWFVRAFGN